MRHKRRRETTNSWICSRCGLWVLKGVDNGWRYLLAPKGGTLRSAKRLPKCRGRVR